MAENNIELKERNSPLTTTQTTVNPKQLKQPVDSMMGKSRITAEQFNTLQNSRIFKKKYQDKWFNGENPAFVKQADGSYLANDYRVKDPNKKGEAVYSKDFKKQIFNPYKRQVFWNKLKQDSWSAAAKNFGFDYTPSNQSKPLFNPKEKTPEEKKVWENTRNKLLELGVKQTEIPTDLNEAMNLLTNKISASSNNETTNVTEEKNNNWSETPSNENPAAESNDIIAEYGYPARQNLVNPYLIDIPQEYQFIQPNTKISDNNKTVTTNNTQVIKNGNKINYLNYYY